MRAAEVIQEAFRNCGIPRRGIAHVEAWHARHMNAYRNPARFEVGIVRMLEALGAYADSHEAQYGCKLGSDYVLGDAWLDMLRGLRALLNGECGRLDCGSLDAAICDLHRWAGFDGEL